MDPKGDDDMDTTHEDKGSFIGNSVYFTLAAMVGIFSKIEVAAIDAFGFVCYWVALVLAFTIGLIGLASDSLCELIKEIQEKLKR